jgi:arginyl-tRNA--protein-N-Asp/Glu arginylyltransferase
MQIAVRETEYGACPYLEDRRWRVYEFQARSFDPALYEGLLREGWRRSGKTFYKAICPGCEYCVPLRLDVGSFRPSRSQRRILKANADVESSLCASEFSEERFELYRKYVHSKHGVEESPEPIARASYVSFLLGGPLGSAMIVDYRSRLDGRLLANGYVDLLPEGLSSVYFAFAPEESRRSLGTLSVMRELTIAGELGKRYYYLGFWVPGSPKMDYKANFRPFEYARGSSWARARDRADAMTAMVAP